MIAVRIGMVSCLSLVATILRAQSSAPAGDAVLTLREALALADANFPRIRARAEEARAADAALTRVRETYAPSIDVGGQVSRATDNNLTGLYFSQSVLEPISGAVRPDNVNNSIYGSAIGATATWSPFTFGRREAEVHAAHAERNRAVGAATNERFQHALDAGSAYMNALGAEALLRVQRDNLARATAVVRSVVTLARSGLRAGADSLLAQADESHARLALFAAERDVTAARRFLAEAIGGAPGQRAVTAPFEASPFLDRVPDSTTTAPLDLTAHPAAAPLRAEVEAGAARRAAITRSLFPTLSIVGAAFDRGSGVTPDGRFDPSLNGLHLTKVNYAAGIEVGLPLGAFISAGPRIGEATALERSATAQYDGEVQHLSAQLDVAVADLSLARRQAAETPLQRAAAAGAAQQMNARYTAGLATLADVAQAQLALTRAETDDVLARLGAWRARLALAGASGDLAPFLALLQ